MKTTLKSTLKALLTLTFILTLLLNGTAFAQSAFAQTAAENLALEAAGATRERALLFPTEIETEHGQTAYDVEFRCDGFEYEYWISTTDGAIIKRAWALTSQKTLEMAAYQDAAAIVIGEQQALDKALADAGLTEADITLLEISVVYTAVFNSPYLFAPNSWEMTTAHPMLLPTATAIKIIVMG